LVAVEVADRNTMPVAVVVEVIGRMFLVQLLVVGKVLNTLTQSNPVFTG
jgi:hypothetical protein